MEDNIPPNQSSQETKHAAGFLQGDRRSSVAISHGKVARCHCQEAKINKEEDQDVGNIAWKRCDQERENKDRPQYHEEPDRIVILGGASPTVRLRDTECRCQDCAVASVEKT